MFSVYNYLNKLYKKKKNLKRKSPDHLKKSKALLIGINYENTSNSLYGCINDSKNVEKVLKRENYTELMMINDKTEQKPTYENIIKGIEWLVKDSHQYETIFFHYSGHGSNVFDNDGDEDDRRDECLVSLDNKMITDDILFEKLINQIKTRLVCIIDACHSGTMLDLEYSVKMSPQKVSGNSYNPNNWKSNEQIIRNEKKKLEHNFPVFFISGCQDNEYSADAYIKNSSQGALTYTFLDIYKYNKNITCKDLLKKIHIHLELSKYDQNPVFSTNDIENYNKIFEL